MSEKDNIDDWKHISFEELSNVIEEYNEVRIDLDEFAAFVSECNQEYIREQADAEINEETVVLMRNAMNRGDYNTAFLQAKKLRYNAYSKYKNEIDICYKRCADEGVVDALISLTKPYIESVNCKIEYDIFKYLKDLSDAGYINSFYKLGTCYHYGNNCEKDLDKAVQLYFEGFIFCNNIQCKRYIEESFMNLKLYKKGDMYKELINDLLCNDYDLNNRAKIRFAELIFEEKIEDYSIETAYLLLKELYYYDESGILTFLLGKCLLYGLGTSVNFFVAKYLFEEAYDSLSNIIEYYDKKKIVENFHEGIDVDSVYKQTKELLQFVNEKITEINSKREIYVDEEKIIDGWMKEEVLFIKRNLKLNSNES